jgi:hypothetical protein
VSLLSLLDGTFSLLDVELGLGLLLFRFSQLSIILVLISLSDWTEMFQAESPTTEVRSSVSLFDLAGGLVDFVGDVVQPPQEVSLDHVVLSKVSERRCGRGSGHLIEG